MSRNRNESSEGFTLIELLVVIVIIGILIAIAIPLRMRWQERSKSQQAPVADVVSYTVNAQVCVLNATQLILPDRVYDRDPTLDIKVGDVLKLGINRSNKVITVGNVPAGNEVSLCK